MRCTWWSTSKLVYPVWVWQWTEHRPTHWHLLPAHFGEYRMAFPCLVIWRWCFCAKWYDTSYWRFSLAVGLSIRFDGVELYICPFKKAWDNIQRILHVCKVNCISEHCWIMLSSYIRDNEPLPVTCKPNLACIRILTRIIEYTTGVLVRRTDGAVPTAGHWIV